MSDSFVIDNMVIGHLAQMHARFQDWNWPTGILKTSRYVAAKEALGDVSRESCIAQPWFEIVDSPADGEAAKFEAAELVPPGTTSSLDPGELSCIGVAHAQNLSFVTHEKKGFLVGAASLGFGRVLLAYDMWLEFERRGLVTADDRRRLCEVAWKKEKQLVLLQPKRTR